MIDEDDYQQIFRVNRTTRDKCEASARTNCSANHMPATAESDDSTKRFRVIAIPSPLTHRSGGSASAREIIAIYISYFSSRLLIIFGKNEIITVCKIVRCKPL